VKRKKKGMTVQFRWAASALAPRCWELLTTSRLALETIQPEFSSAPESLTRATCVSPGQLPRDTAWSV
jgi:hypothetical protein